MCNLQLVAGNYDVQISILSVILKCEWGLSVTQEALVTSVSGTNGAWYSICRKRIGIQSYHLLHIKRDLNCISPCVYLL